MDNKTILVKFPYSAPVFERYGKVSDLTQNVGTLGKLDGAPVSNPNSVAKTH